MIIKFSFRLFNHCWGFTRENGQASSCSTYNDRRYSITLKLRILNIGGAGDIKIQGKTNPISMQTDGLWKREYGNGDVEIIIEDQIFFSLDQT